MAPADPRRFGIELALWIGDWITCGSNRDRDSRPVFHGFQGPFDRCCWALWALGLAFPTDPEGTLEDELPFQGTHGLPSGYFRFLAQSEVRRRLERGAGIDRDSLDDLLQTCLVLMDHDGHLPRSRDWFDPVYGDHLMNAFAAAGFAEHRDGKYRWTEAIAPYMAACGYWTETGRDCRELFAEELKAFLSQLPDAARYELIDLGRGPGSDLFILERIIDGLNHEGWLRHFPLYGNSPVAIARDIQNLLRPIR